MVLAVPRSKTAHPLTTEPTRMTTTRTKTIMRIASTDAWTLGWNLEMIALQWSQQIAVYMYTSRMPDTTVQCSGKRG